MYTRAELASEFTRLGVKPGDAVMLHASIRAVGAVAGGPDQIHLALKDALTDAGTLTNGRIFCDCTAGRFDGMRFDDAGRLWAAADDGVHCLAPDGMLLGKVLIPEICSNVVFGGPKRNYLFVTATTSLYGVLMPVNGLKTF